MASIIGSAFLNISDHFCSSAGHWRQEHRPGVGPGAPHRSGEARRCRCQDQVPGGRGNGERMTLANWEDESEVTLPARRKGEINPA